MTAPGERERLVRLGYCVAASCVVPGLLQGWRGLDPVTGSFDTEDEAWEAIARNQARSEKRWKQRATAMTAPGERVEPEGWRCWCHECQREQPIILMREPGGEGGDMECKVCGAIFFSWDATALWGSNWSDLALLAQGYAKGLTVGYVEATLAPVLDGPFSTTEQMAARALADAEAAGERREREAVIRALDEALQTAPTHLLSDCIRQLRDGIQRGAHLRGEDGHEPKATS